MQNPSLAFLDTFHQPDRQASVIWSGLVKSTTQQLARAVGGGRQDTVAPSRFATRLETVVKRCHHHTPPRRLDAGLLARCMHATAFLIVVTNSLCLSFKSSADFWRCKRWFGCFLHSRVWVGVEAGYMGMGGRESDVRLSCSTEVFQSAF